MNKAKGLTLIEVLVALAIIGIAMTAIVKATAEHIRATQYLQTKTVATWVATLVFNEATLGLRPWPAEMDKPEEKETMLGRDWYWQWRRLATGNPMIKKVVISVYDAPPDNDAVSPVVQLEGFFNVNRS